MIFCILDNHAEHHIRLTISSLVVGLTPAWFVTAPHQIPTSSSLLCLVDEFQCLRHHIYGHARPIIVLDHCFPPGVIEVTNGPSNTKYEENCLYGALTIAVLGGSPPASNIRTLCSLDSTSLLETTHPADPPPITM